MTPRTLAAVGMAVAALVTPQAPARAEHGATADGPRVDRFLEAVAADDAERAATLGADRATLAAMLATHVHGVDDALAERWRDQVRVPTLLELLREPLFPRRDNVVAFLALLGDDRATAALLAHARRPAMARWSPEEDRALLLVPTALGMMASRGWPAALGALLDLTGPQGGRALLADAPSVPDPDRLRQDLLRAAVRSLPRARHPDADARTAALQSGVLRPAGARFDAAAEARASRRLAADLRDTGAGKPPGTEGGEAKSLVTHSTYRAHGFTYANHVDVAPDSIMTDGDLDRILALSSLRIGRADSADDIACCMGVRRQGTAGNFGSPGDQLDVIDDSGEAGMVIRDPVARFKVVRLINWCGGAINAIGCNLSGADGVAVVRRNGGGTAYGDNIESVVWAHEYGHALGLLHEPDDERALMYFFIDGNNDHLSVDECDTFHSPVRDATILSEVACEDRDGDDVVDEIDNCTQFANPDQADGDGDGIGDICECPTGEPDEPDDVQVVEDGTVTWTLPADADSAEVVSGSLASLTRLDGVVAARCLEGDLGESYEDDRIGTGSVYYLVRARSDCGDSGIGSGTGGHERTAQTCP